MRRAVRVLVSQCGHDGLRQTRIRACAGGQFSEPLPQCVLRREWRIEQLLGSGAQFLEVALHKGLQKRLASGEMPVEGPDAHARTPRVGPAGGECLPGCAQEQFSIALRVSAGCLHHVDPPSFIEAQ